MNLNKYETAIFANGCFWCSEAIFQKINGVKEVKPGYIGGKTENPTYEDVCTGLTDHAEAIEIIFDAKLVSYQELLEVFFATHDPTTLNRQGNDVGDNYRSGIYSTDKATEAIVKTEVAKLAKNYRKPVVVEMIALKNFYKAEDYHQDYLDKNPGGYCHIPMSVFDEARNANPPKVKK